MPNDTDSAPETDISKAIAASMAKVSAAESDTFMARLDAIDAITQGASSHETMLLCAHALSNVVPTCCAEREGEFKTDFLTALDSAIAMQREQDEAESDEAAASESLPNDSV